MPGGFARVGRWLQTALDGVCGPGGGGESGAAWSVERRVRSSMGLAQGPSPEGRKPTRSSRVGPCVVSPVVHAVENMCALRRSTSPERSAP